MLRVEKGYEDERSNAGYIWNFLEPLRGCPMNNVTAPSHPLWNGAFESPVPWITGIVIGNYLPIISLIF